MTQGERIAINIQIMLFPTLQSETASNTTVWSISHSYPFNGTAMQSYTYHVDGERLAQMSADQFWQVLGTVAQTVAPMCEAYEAEVVCARDGVTDTKRGGFLPENKERCAIFIDQLIDWFQECCEQTELVFILCTDCGQNSKEPQIKMRYHEESHQWYLNVTATEFGKVQRALVEANLPSDLFTKDDQLNLSQQFSPVL